MYLLWSVPPPWKILSFSVTFFFKGLSTTLQFVTEPTSLFLETSLRNGTPYMFYPSYLFQGHSLSFLLKRKYNFSSSLQKQKSALYWPLKYSFPCFYFLCLFKTTIKWKVDAKNKMDNPDLLMKEPFHWFKTKIMMIAIHRIQAG